MCGHPAVSTANNLPLWAASIDLVVFGVVPSAWAIVGGALVIGAGLILLFWDKPRASTPAAEVGVDAE